MSAIPDQATVPEDPWILAAVAFDPSYVGGWSAAEHWDLTEQIFAETFVVTARSVRSKRTTMLGLRFRLVRVDSVERVMNTGLVWRGAERVRASSPERTVADGLNSPDWLGGWRHLLDVLQRYLEGEPDRASLEAELLANGRGAAFKRLGFALEHRHPEEGALLDFVAGHTSAGIIKLDPDLPDMGSINTRWGVRVNTEFGAP